MLDAVIDFLPSPVDIPDVQGEDESGKAITRKADDKEGFTALAFKLMTDPFVGQLTFIRVYSGVLNKGDTVYNSVKGRKERIGRIVQMHANNREEVDEVLAGDIAACIGLKDVTTGESLCSPDKPIILERMVFPEPVIHVAVEPKTKSDQEKMGLALGRLAQEDPSFRVRSDEESGQTIISGMGELHLDIIVDRMKREFGVEASVGADLQSGLSRLTFGSDAALEGIETVPVIVSIFALGEALYLASRFRDSGWAVIPMKGKALMSREDWKRSWKPWIRGTFLGFPLGVVPAGGSEVPTFLSYSIEKKLSKQPEEFGNGAIEGVAGPEAANNANAAGALVPLLALGLPTSATAAVILVAFQTYQIQPGPTLFLTE